MFISLATPVGAKLLGYGQRPKSVLGWRVSLGFPSDNAFGTQFVSTTRLIADCLSRQCVLSFPVLSPQRVSSVWATWCYQALSQKKKGRGRQGGPEQQLNKKDFSSDQEQARSNDRHVQHDVIGSGAAKDQQQKTTVHLVSFALHAACLTPL